MDERKAFWLAEAERYVDECRRNASSVRVSEFAYGMKRTAVQLGRELDRKSVV